MDYVEIELKAKTVDLAVEAAMQELNVDDREQLTVEVISDPVKGFLGVGSQDAVVRVKKKPARKRRNRGRRNDRTEASSRRDSGKGGKGRQGGRNDGKNGQGKSERKPPRQSKPSGKHEKRDPNMSDDRPSLAIEEQARVTREFLEGLVEAYGLEGSVVTEVEDEVIIANVEGDQTEAMVGIRGSVRSAIHELTRTVLQRYTQDTARLRLDIAGYAERRREALSIYANQLITQLMEEGGEIMLEPMSPADRKVIHDAASENDQVTSYSEGEQPRRYVVLSRVESSEEE